LKEFDSGINRNTILAVVLALIVGIAMVTSSILWTSHHGPPIPTTTTTPTTGPPADGYGPLAAQYINSRRDDVVAFWVYNCTLVNVDISNYYHQTEPSAYVDGVLMKRSGEETNVEVLFHPYTADLVGTGSLDVEEWNALSGSIVDDGIGQMIDAVSHPTYFPDSWPPRFHLEIFFNDNTFFFCGFTVEDGLVYIQYGTWTGGYRESGWPDVTGYNGGGNWLVEDGCLQAPMTNFYNAITQKVSYPSGS
jgi:hypothetical protein